MKRNKTEKKQNSLLLRLRTSQLNMIVTMFLVLFLLGTTGFLILNANNLANYIKENVGYSVVLKSDAKESEIKRFQKELKLFDFVKNTEYISKDRAAKELKNDLGEDFIEYLGYNPLPVSINVYLFAKYSTKEELNRIENEILKFDIVKELNYRKDLVSSINNNIESISLVILVFTLFLYLVAFALINNTVRLAIYSKRFLINTMQLIGATQAFIRKPFLWQSIINGFIASILAILAISGLIILIDKNFHQIIDKNIIFLSGILFAIIVVLGIIIMLISTYFAVNKYLRINTTELYYR